MPIVFAAICRREGRGKGLRDAGGGRSGANRPSRERLAQMEGLRAVLEC